MFFSVHLIESIKNDISISILIKINEEEYNQMIAKIRKKIYEEFVKNEIVPVLKIPNYVICGEEGDSENLEEKFSYLKTIQNYIFQQFHQMI